MARELSQLGEQPAIEPGGVTWEGDARSLLRANLWLRTASRVIVRVTRFRATAFHELERAAKRIHWEQFVTDPAAVEFNVTARKSKLYHTGGIEQRLRDAVRSRLSALGGSVQRKPHQPGPESSKPGARSPEPETATPSQLFIVRVVRDEFEISADASGELLHLRGYRQAVAKAPIRETLAAALLLAAGYDGGAPLLDPFCGSGTIPIEGALIARNIAPGIQRTFGVEDWPSFYPPISKAIRDEAFGRQRAAASAITGSDRDTGAIAAATANAERAGIAGSIAWFERPISSMEHLPAGGLIATNPPYGVRVGKGGDVRDLFAQLGHVTRQQASGSRVAMYLPDTNLGKQTRLDFETLYKTSNGGLPVTAVLASVS